MSCARVREIGKELSPAELDVFRDHARECAECGRLLARFEGAYRLLRAEELPAFSRQKRAELLAHLAETERSSRWAFVRPAAFAAAAAVVAALIVTWPKEQATQQAQNIAAAAAAAAAAKVGEGETASWIEPGGEPAIREFFTGIDPRSLETSFPDPAAAAADDRAPQIASTSRRAALERKTRRKDVEPAAPEPDVKELLSSADHERRRGDWSAAAETYERVAEHTNGAPYAEEALLRRAQILAAHEAIDSALAALSAARDRSPDGTLASERAVLEAQLYLRRFDAESAADAIERAGDERTLAVLRARIEVAEALAASSPERAKRLVQPVLASKVSSELNERARRIDSGAKGNE